MVISAFLALPPMAAQAHAVLLFTTPAADGAVPSSPASLSLVFSEPVSPAAEPLVLVGERGDQARVAQPRMSGGGRAMTARVLTNLAPQLYTVTWTVTSSDGDAMTGRFTFAVGAHAPPASLAAGSPSVGWTTIARWLLFTCYAIALGALAGRRLARRQAPELTLPRPFAFQACLAGLAAALGLALSVAGGGNPFSGLSDPLRLADSQPGLIAAAEAGAFALAAICLLVRRHGLATAALLVFALAEGVRAHPNQQVAGIGAALTVVHLVAAALWVGGLLYVIRVGVAWRADPPAVRRVLGAYARSALWLFLAVASTGLISALVLVPMQDVLTTDYGLWLLAKLALVAMAVACALLARRRIATPPYPARAARVELGVLAGILAVTSILLALPTPRSAGEPLPFPPPATGPQVPVGGRAGQVGVYGTASAGQLVLRLSVASLGDGDPPEFEPTATVLGPGSPARRLALRGCGRNCFVAPVTWRPGINTVTLRVTDDSKTALTVAWPVTPDPARLRRLVEVMAAVPEFVLHEQVTSDTRRPPGIDTRLDMTGKRLLDSDPYGSGTATITAWLPDSSTLLLGYPSERVAVRLTLDRTGRIARETLVGPNHLITRTFIYPDV
ncbi:copper resistance CopC/CopD family protein [Nonomuraea sp. 10N515B]|uniref:copper resistance CopC/CopD family protein n=1 Tax=Nonomuraea sp. 10N515B TaxID=3457422 RepID=UPI003FCE1C9C